LGLYKVKLIHDEEPDLKIVNLVEISKRNLPPPLIGKNSPIVKPIEYESKVYYGWRELKEATGVSKHLYKKYYLNGIDPTFRIGTDGPVSQ